MTRQERRKRRRQRRRMQAALLASLLFALVLIVTLRIRETAPEPVAERRNALTAERQTLTSIAPARPEAAEETPEELMQSLSAVTPERICAAAQSIRLDTVYFLRGKEAAQ